MTNTSNNKTVVSNFYPNGNRYMFDSKFLAKKAWVQLDTTEDASYYGNWVNRQLRKIVNYAEGDYTETTYATDEAFIKGLRTCLASLEKYGYQPMLDTYENEEQYSDFKAYCS